MVEVAAKSLHDAVELLNKAYNELIAICSDVSLTQWADATQVDGMGGLIEEIKYWSARVQEIVQMRGSSSCHVL